ncbi:MAG: thioredoxin [Deferribacteres bacterium]|nr:thioredoxin [candidate division KSB1 bacterium]MCB9508669.1 thioredoxin [Deferribacteres bacterium]
MSNQSVKVSTATFDSEVIKSNKPVLVDFWAPWCAPCRAIAPILDDLANEMGDSVKIAKLNTDENIDLAREYQVFSIPTLMIFHNGQVVDQFIGLQPKSVLKDKLTYYAGAAATA